MALAAARRLIASTLQLPASTRDHDGAKENAQVSSATNCQEARTAPLLAGVSAGEFGQKESAAYEADAAPPESGRGRGLGVRGLPVHASNALWVIWFRY
jgi:hypothetical protein